LKVQNPASVIGNPEGPEVTAAQIAQAQTLPDAFLALDEAMRRALNTP